MCFSQLKVPFKSPKRQENKANSSQWELVVPLLFLTGSRVQAAPFSAVEREAEGAPVQTGEWGLVHAARPACCPTIQTAGCFSIIL